MNNPTKKRSLRVIAALLAMVMVIGGSLAYFSDSAETSANGTAGTVDVELDGSGINLLDEDGKQILNPGDSRDVYFEVSNKGNKSVDIRTTITLTSSIGMDKNGQAEFEIYRLGDVEYVDGEGWKPVDGAEPLQIRSISDDGYTITYAVPEYILNGNEELSDNMREIEPDVAVDKDPYFDVSDGGSIADSKYVLIFKTSSDNNYQEANVTLNVKVEAKQHRNTEAGWELVGSTENEQPGDGTDQYVATYVLRGNGIPSGTEVVADGATDSDPDNNSFGFQSNRPMMMMMRSPYSGNGTPDAVVIDDITVTTESGEDVPVDSNMSFTTPAENITIEITASVFDYDYVEQIPLRDGESFVTVYKKYEGNGFELTATLYEKNENGSWIATQVTPKATVTEDDDTWKETLVAANGDKMEVSDHPFIDEIQYTVTLAEGVAEEYNLTYQVSGDYSDNMNFWAYLTKEDNATPHTTYPANEIRFINVEDTITDTYRAPYKYTVEYRTASGAPLALNANNSFTTPAEDIVVYIYVEEQYMYALSENYLFVTDGKGSTWVYDGTMGRGWNGSAEGLITLSELDAMNLMPIQPNNVIYNVSDPYDTNYPRVEVIIGDTNYRLDCQRQYSDYRIMSVNPLTEEVPEGPTADELLYQSLGGYSISYRNKFADGAGVTNKSDYYELIAGPTAAETYIFTKYVYSDEWADWVDNMDASGSQLNHIRVTPDSLTHYKVVDEFGNAEGYYIVFEIDGYTYVAKSLYSSYDYIQSITAYAPGTWTCPDNWVAQ